MYLIQNFTINCVPILTSVVMPLITHGLHVITLIFPCILTGMLTPLIVFGMLPSAIVT